MCSNLNTTTASTDSRVILKDSRDSKFYKVAKLADGNCWMVSNLALDGTDLNGNVRTLTTKDSDVITNRTLAANITSESSNTTSVQIISSVANNTTSSCDTNSNPYCIVSSEPYGNLYNWYAATATTGTASLTRTEATDSICPKNWKLPTSGTSSAYGTNAPNRSYGKLLYSVLGFTDMRITSSDNGGTYIQQVQQAPLWFPLSGTYAGHLGDTGVAGNYWSNRASDTSSNGAYKFGFNARYGTLYPQSSTSSKVNAFAVRCVLNSS